MAAATASQGPISNLPSAPAYQESNGKLDQSQLHTSKTQNDRIPRGPVTGLMNFYKAPEDGSPPYFWVEPPTDGSPQKNFDSTPKDITINDLRGRESEYNLDKHAFAALQNWPRHNSIDWDNDEDVKANYYPEVEKLLLNEIPGSPYKILLFDHTVRHPDPGAKRGPVQRCHIDQTPKSARLRVEFHLSEEEAQEVLKNNTRYRIINVWRPINGAVESFPLGFANTATVPDSDMVGVEHRYPNRTGETAAVKYNPDHEWLYWSGIDDDERLLLQCFDSHNHGSRVPHSAFADPRSDENSKGRGSIEVRALILG